VQQITGWLLIIFPGILFIGQIISSVNFTRAEKYTAYWDLVVLGWLPLSGILMVINNPVWPLVAFFGSAIYLDTAGREAAKILSFKHEGIRIGSTKQQRFFFATYIIMAVISKKVL